MGKGYEQGSQRRNSITVNQTHRKLTCNQRNTNGTNANYNQASIFTYQVRKKKKVKPCAGMDVEQETHTLPVGAWIRILLRAIQKCIFRLKGAPSQSSATLIHMPEKIGRRIFILTPFATVNNQKSPRYPQTIKWINKLWYIHTKKCHTTIKMNECELSK